MTLSPTPPQPSTATELPGLILATFTAEPNPVITPQPTMQAEVNGTPFGSGVTAAARTRVRDERVPRLNERSTGRPFQVVPFACAWPFERSMTYAGFVSSQSTSSPRLH